MRSKSSRKVKRRAAARHGGNAAAVLFACLVLALVCFCMTGCSGSTADVGEVAGENVPSLSEDEIPAYEGEPYVTVNGNEPEFDDRLMKEESFEPSWCTAPPNTLTCSPFTSSPFSALYSSVRSPKRVE